jgi:hypothetical protein
MSDTSELVDALMSLGGSQRYKLYRNGNGILHDHNRNPWPWRVMGRREPC